MFKCKYFMVVLAYASNVAIEIEAIVQQSYVPRNQLYSTGRSGVSYNPCWVGRKLEEEDADPALLEKCFKFIDRKFYDACVKIAKVAKANSLYLLGDPQINMRTKYKDLPRHMKGKNHQKTRDTFFNHGFIARALSRTKILSCQVKTQCPIYRTNTKSKENFMSSTPWDFCENYDYFR